MNKRRIGVLLSYANSIINMIVGLVLSTVLLRFLGDIEYGVYQTIASFANYLVLLEFGTGTVMTRNIAMARSKNSSKDAIDSNTSTIWTVTNILSFLILVVSVVFYFLIDIIYCNSLSQQQISHAKNIFLPIVAYLLLSFYLQTLNGVILANEHYSYASIINIFRTVIRATTLILILSFIKNSIVIAFTDAALTGIIVIVTYIYCKLNFNICLSFMKFKFSIFTNVLPLCFAIFLQSIVNQANNNVDKFLIGMMLYPEAVTMYSISLFIYNTFSSLTTIPVSLYGPQIVKDVASDITPDSLTETLIQPSRLIVLTGGTIVFGFISFGKQFISLFYGASYTEAWLYAVILMIPAFINMANGVIVNVLDAMNKRHVRSFVLLGTTTLNILLTVVWLQLFGMLGAAIATAISTLLGQVIIMNIYYSKKIHIRIMYLFYNTFKGILISQILSMILSVLSTLLITDTWFSFIVGAIVYIVSFGAIYLLFGANNSEKQMLKKYLFRLKRK